MPQIADALRDWFRSCPSVQKGNRFGVDHLSANPTEYAIYMSPSPLDSYIDITGEVQIRPVQTVNFIFASREASPSLIFASVALITASIATML